MNKPSIYQQTIDSLQEKIGQGDWQPGQRLPTMKQLSKDFGVSITTMREALKSLENQNMISIEHGRGMYVRNDPQALHTMANDQIHNLSLLSLLEARLLVEPQQAFFCAQNPDAAVGQKLQQLTEKMDSEMRTGGDFLAVDLKFHEVIAENAQQPAMQIMSSALMNYQIESRQHTNTLPNMRAKAASYHQLISAAIIAHDAEEARTLMAMHIRSMIAPLQNK